MKIAVIWSSPNTDGLTASAKNQIMEGIKSYGAEIDEIHLNRCHIEHCLACGDGWSTCRSQGKCVLKDDFTNLYERLVAADGIVFVSAVYWQDLTECFKAFLDRLRRCEATHNNFLAEKRCLLVACGGGTGNGTMECLQHLEYTLKHMGMRAYDRLPVIRYNKDYILPMLKEAGRTYAERTEKGFEMWY